MKRWSRDMVGVVVVAGLLLFAAHAGAETCKLELKQVDSTAPAGATDQVIRNLVRSTYPQHFFQQLGGPEGRIVGPANGNKPKFADVIEKEPDYTSESPFRGVAELGSHHYGFALDIAKPEPEKEEADDKSEGEKKEGDSEGGLLSMLSKTFVEPLTPKAKTGEAPAFRRLHFDLNRNGDLTDDEVIEAQSAQSYSTTTSQSMFPVTKLTIDVGRKKLDYAFSFRIYANVSSSMSYASASLHSAAYREGEMKIGGKNRRIVLVDFNSNGRFDDAFGINEDIQPADGSVYPKMGDMLYIDPQQPQGYWNPYDSTSNPGQYQLGKLIEIDGRFFDLDVAASGETLSLEPSALPLGYVTNPNKGFQAIVYGDLGMLEISSDESGKAPLPQGEWKLLSYTLRKTKADEPETEEDKEGKEEEMSLLDILSSALPQAVSSAVQVERPTMVSARAKGDYAAVKVVDGETAEMRFGPPYTPTVSAPVLRKGMGTASLSMSLVGTGGEVCSSLIVNGSQPSAPEFTISTADGEEVAVGKFKYG